MNLQRIKELCMRYKWYLCFSGILVGVLCMIFVIKISQGFQKREVTTPIVMKTDVKEEKSKIVVDIKGEVKKPGVYEVNENSTVLDVMNKAEGLTEQADTSYLNLSKRVKDEMVIIVYSKMEIEKMKQGESNVVVVEGECKCPEITNDGCIDTKNQITNVPSTTKEKQNGKVNINTATASELESLTGIGSKKAQDIIEFRNTNGGFKKLEDLKEVKGIGDSIYQKLKDQITI